MSLYKIKIDKAAFLDIEEISEWYNQRVKNLGSRFEKNTRLQINTLKYNAPNYSIRYKKVRCMLVRKFPFLIHYTIDEVIIRSLYLPLSIQAVILKFGSKKLKKFKCCI